MGKVIIICIIVFLLSFSAVVIPGYLFLYPSDTSMPEDSIEEMQDDIEAMPDDAEFLEEPGEEPPIE